MPPCFGSYRTDSFKINGLVSYRALSVPLEINHLGIPPRFKEIVGMPIGLLYHNTTQTANT